MKTLLSILLGTIVLGLIIFLVVFKIKLFLIIAFGIIFLLNSYFIGTMIIDLIFNFRI